MIVRATRDVKGKRYIIRILLESFDEEEIYYLAKHGPLELTTPLAHIQGYGGDAPVRFKTDLKQIPFLEFWVTSPAEAERFIDELMKILHDRLDSFLKGVADYVHETVFEVKAGEEIKRINDGAKRALDKGSAEYKEIIERNREAFKKLSKL